MDKLSDLKEIIALKYGKMLVGFTKGHALKIDKDLLGAIQAVDDIGCYAVSTLRRDIVINYYLMKLRNGK